MKAKLIILLLMCSLIIPTAATAAGKSDILLYINGRYITTGAPPVMINNSTYIPFRAFFENVGAGFTVMYRSDLKSAVAYANSGSYRIAFSIGSKRVEVASQFIEETESTVRISNPPILHKGSVYVPIRAFGDLLGANVRYDRFSNTVTVSLTDEQIKDKVYPLIGRSVDGPEEAAAGDLKPLTAKEIYATAVAVGYVEVLDEFEEPVCSGSGFMVYPNYFVTNSHVASCSTTGKLVVKIAGSVYHNGDEGWYHFDNADRDLYGTVISTSFDEEGYATGDSPPTVFNIVSTELPEIGDKIYAIGSPQGLENSISEGIVSGIREQDGMTYIQHTADIDHGSSGGVLLDQYGYVIGITSSGIEGSNLEFAIPILYLKEELVKLGVEFEE
jgi:serine protease Do